MRNLQQWDEENEKHQQTRKVCARQNNPAYYRAAIEKRSDETIANIAIILIRQTDYLIKQYFDYVKQDFLKNGGIREEMTRERLKYRKEHGK